ncbi:MAG: endonuclease/exonuclease/phosphatase family protein [Planctomycetaceae bacterium]
MNQKTKAPRTARSGLRKVLLGLSGVFAAGLIYCYQAQPDRLAGLTIVPACAWPVAGLLSALLFGGRSHKAFTLTVLALWAMFTYTSVEETRSLLRRDELPTPSWRSARDEDRLLKIVSLNCNAHEDAAAEVGEYKPDVVFIQESPSREQLQKLTTDLFGSEGGFVWTAGASIAARGKVESKSADESSFFVHASIQLSNGRQFEAVCLRLKPPLIRYDLWKGEYWRAHQAARAERRADVKTLMQYVASLPSTTPIVVGGDLGAAPEDAALSRLRGNLSDTFAAAGHGWGNTVTNGYPVERFDQVWVNEQLQPEWVEAHKSGHSDHRLVVCDISLHPIVQPDAEQIAQ